MPGRAVQLRQSKNGRMANTSATPPDEGYHGSGRRERESALSVNRFEAGINYRPQPEFGLKGPAASIHVNLCIADGLRDVFVGGLKNGLGPVRRFQRLWSYLKCQLNDGAYFGRLGIPKIIMTTHPL